MEASPLARLQPPLYQNCRSLESGDSGIRIYAPMSYAIVRQAQVVPIVHTEALRMASWFPICWQARQSEPILVVLRTLHSDGSHQPAGSPALTGSLPFALQAYPFVVGAPGSESGKAHLFDDAIPDQPTDVGSPVTTMAGKPARGADLKIRAATAFNSALALTEAMTAALADSGMFEPWPLDFDVSAQKLSVNDLLVIQQKDTPPEKVARFVRTFGSAGATLIGAHRISLFRAGSLLQSAQAGAPTNRTM